MEQTGGHPVRHGLEQHAIECDGAHVWHVDLQFAIRNGADAGASQALQVTFTPADTVDYATVSDTVSINVNHLAVTSLTPTPNGDGTPRDERARTKG